MSNGPVVDAEALAARLARALPRVEPEVIAAALAERLPTLDVGELTAKLESLHATANAKLDTLVERLGVIDDELHGTEGKAGESTRRIVQAVWGSSALIAVAIVAAVTLVNPEPSRTVAPQSVPPVSNVFFLVGTMDREQLPEALRGQGWPYGGHGWISPGSSGHLGQRKTGLPMPSHPLPHQAKSPCILGATTVHGVCWLKIADQKPPCLPGFYSHEGACYAPLAANPKQPVGEDPLPPDSKR